MSARNITILTGVSLITCIVPISSVSFSPTSQQKSLSTLPGIVQA